MNYISLFKTSTTGKASNENQENGENTERGNRKTKKNLKIVVPLQHLSSFQRLLDMPLFNCEVFLTLTWPENFVLADITTQATRTAQRDDPARPAINAPRNAIFQIADTKLYVPVVTFSIERLLEQLRKEFKRTVKWNKYRSEMTNQTQNNNLNYLIDPRFTKVNRLFVLSFKRENDRTSHYVPEVHRKDFNVLIDGKSFSEMLIKYKEETYEQVIEIGRNNDYTTVNLLGYDSI